MSYYFDSKLSRWVYLSPVRVSRPLSFPIDFSTYVFEVDSWDRVYDKGVSLSRYRVGTARYGVRYL